MTKPAGAGGAATTEVGGPAAVAGALQALDRHARTLVKLVLTHRGLQGGDLAVAVGEQHDRISRVLHDVQLEHGTEAMLTSAEYAAAAFEAGSLYPGEELETFLRDVAGRVRATSKDLTKSTPFGG